MIEPTLTSLSDALERDGYLVLPGVFSNEQIEEAEAAIRRDCSGARPERFDEAHPFPEKTYLRHHLDIRATVAKRRIPSAFAHYREDSFAEGLGI